MALHDRLPIHRLHLCSYPKESYSYKKSAVHHSTLYDHLKLYMLKQTATDSDRVRLRKQPHLDKPYSTLKNKTNTQHRQPNPILYPSQH